MLLVLEDQNQKESSSRVPFENQKTKRLNMKFRLPTLDRQMSLSIKSTSGKFHQMSPILDTDNMRMNVKELNSGPSCIMSMMITKITPIIINCQQERNQLPRIRIQKQVITTIKLRIFVHLDALHSDVNHLPLK